MSDNITKKSFGYEAVWAKAENYIGKIVMFDATNATIPIHYHAKTEKSWFFNSGSFTLKWIDTKTGVLYEKEINEGSVFHVPKLMPVGLKSLTDSGSITQVQNIDDPEDYYQISPEPKEDA